ncbi:hypothetical protein HAX54_029020, partial [Datura stramonium]|nr:hypothetical protein [Datura stramonium]
MEFDVVGNGKSAGRRQWPPPVPKNDCTVTRSSFCAGQLWSGCGDATFWKGILYNRSDSLTGQWNGQPQCGELEQMVPLVSATCAFLGIDNESLLRPEEYMNIVTPRLGGYDWHL